MNNNFTKEDLALVKSKFSEEELALIKQMSDQIDPQESQITNLSKQKKTYLILSVCSFVSCYMHGMFAVYFNSVYASACMFCVIVSCIFFIAGIWFLDYVGLINKVIESNQKSSKIFDLEKIQNLYEGKEQRSTGGLLIGGKPTGGRPPYK